NALQHAKKNQKPQTHAGFLLRSVSPIMSAHIACVAGKVRSNMAISGQRTLLSRKVLKFSRAVSAQSTSADDSSSSATRDDEPCRIIKAI
ncbi:hypothetical protein, partial [Dyella sp.]|uniref:hypothetical protein n=1 Tax=Dyella sp. TaxID=1869338 RepID=UPI002BAE8468